MIVYALLLVCTYLVYKFIKSKDKIDLLGPKPWPIVGNVLQIDPDKPHLTLDKWHHDYNKVYKMYRLGTPVVVVGSAEAMHEMLVKRGQDFAGRPFFYRVGMWSDFSHFQDGIVFAKPDPTWKMLRQTAHKQIKQYDLGMKRIEDVSLEVTEPI